MRRCLALLCALLASPAAAHEFWIDAESYIVDEGLALTARLRNGQEFEGVELAYFSRRFERFDHSVAGVTGPAPGRDGDRPALTIEDPEDGLHVLVYASTTAVVDYDDMESFMRFVTHKDLGPVDEMHAARGLPEAGFVEAYSRYAKALIAVGGGAGEDAAFGLAHELIALENPYTGEMSDGIEVALERYGERRGDAQIELFERAPDGTVEITLHRTDAEGVAVLPVKPGHEYLVDAVILFQPAPGTVADTGAVWETHWAALTFAIPE